MVNSMKKKEDLRIIKTKRNLYEALLSLMKDNTFESIKVSDICTLALTNRSTFYDHFNDKYELLQGLIEDLQIELESKLNENMQVTDIKTAKEYYLKIIELLFDHISENIDIYSSILKNNKSSIAYDMFLDALLKNVEANIDKCKINNGNIPTPVITTFYVSAVINVCLYFIKDKKQYTKEEVLTFLDELLPSIIY